MSVWLPDLVSNFFNSKFWQFWIFFDKMVSILMNIIQHEQYFFSFLLSAHSSQSHTTSCLGLMSHHRVNNKCNRVNGWGWRWLIYALRNILLCNNMLRVFRSNHHFVRVWQISQKNTCVGVFFSLKMMKLYKDICFAGIFFW